jgi:dUTP pyrophosphatase
MVRFRGFEVCKGFEDKNINLPQRQTKNAAGYDFECAETIVIESLWKKFMKIFTIKVTQQLQFLSNFTVIGLNEDYDGFDKLFKPVLVPTGVKSYMAEDEGLFLYNRSGNPLKKGLLLANGVGVVDSDYYSNKDNDGHIMFQFINFFPFDIEIQKGERIGQGIFQKFLLTDDDKNTGSQRESGFGSTN